MLNQMLFEAVQGDDFEIVKKTLSSGAQIDYRDKFGQTPIYYIKSSKVGQLLLDSGANVNDKISDADLYSPLHHAALSGLPEVIRFLVDAGADLDAVARERKTSLALAIENAEDESALALIDLGADVTITDMYNWSPLTYAFDGRRVDIVKAILGTGKIIIDSAIKLELASYRPLNEGNFV